MLLDKGDKWQFEEHCKNVKMLDFMTAKLGGVAKFINKEERRRFLSPPYFFL